MIHLFMGSKRSWLVMSWTASSASMPFHTLTSPPHSGTAPCSWTAASRPTWLSHRWSTPGSITMTRSSTPSRSASCPPGRPRSCDHPPPPSTTPFLRQKAWGQAEYLAGRRGSAAEHSRHPAILHRPPEFIVPNRRAPPTARRHMPPTPPPRAPQLLVFRRCTARFSVLLRSIPYVIMFCVVVRGNCKLLKFYHGIITRQMWTVHNYYSRLSQHLIRLIIVLLPQLLFLGLMNMLEMWLV